MFCEKAYTLIKELDRNQDVLPPYNVRSIKLRVPWIEMIDFDFLLERFTQ